MLNKYIIIICLFNYSENTEMSLNLQTKSVDVHNYGV